ncbi:MAG TPA: branched-chain amino acid ABC transporter permease, partial [Clostridiales bacterium]|nr:branched-chain amino acid ABC transporter permease [Clostridiales bacterium]
GDIFMVGAYVGLFVSTALVGLGASGVLALPNWLILVLTIILAAILTPFVGMLVE